MRLRQMRLASPKSLLSPLAIFDVDSGSIPSDDLPGFIAQRYIANNPPAIFSVCPPNPRFTLRGLPVLNGCVPIGDDLCPVIGMKNRFPLPPECLVQSQTCELQPAIINEINLTLGRSAPDMRRNRIDHVAKLSLAPAGSFRPLLNFLASFLQFNPGLRLFGDIYCGPNKFHEVALLVHDGASDRMLGFDGSVGKKEAVVRFVMSFLHHASPKEIPNPLPILRMNPVKPKVRA